MCPRRNNKAYLACISMQASPNLSQICSPSEVCKLLYWISRRKSMANQQKKCPKNPGNSCYVNCVMSTFFCHSFPLCSFVFPSLLCERFSPCAHLPCRAAHSFEISMHSHISAGRISPISSFTALFFIFPAFSSSSLGSLPLPYHRTKLAPR